MHGQPLSRPVNGRVKKSRQEGEVVDEEAELVLALRPLPM
jgi:hypothetical protein